MFNIKLYNNKCGTFLKIIIYDQNLFFDNIGMLIVVIFVGPEFLLQTLNADICEYKK